MVVKPASYRKALWACLAATALPTAAWAQAAGGGATGIGPSLKAGLDATYFSNIARASQAQAAARGLERSDVRVTPRVDLSIVKRLAGRHSASLSGTVGYDFHARNTRLNRERLSLIAGLDLDLPVCDTTLRANYGRRQSDLGDFAANDPASGKNAETYRGGSARVVCGGSGAIRPMAGIEYQKASNTLASRTVNNHETLSYTGGIVYQSVALGEVTGLVRRTEVRFPNQPLAAGQTNGFDKTAYGVSLTRNIGARLSANAELTYVTLESRQAGTQGFSGLNWDVSAKLIASPRLELNASTTRQLSTSLLIASNYNVSTSYAGSARYALTGRVMLEGGYTHLVRQFVGRTAPVGAPLVRDVRDTAYLGGNYTLNPRIALHLRGTRDQRTGGGPLYDYTDYRAMAGFDLAI